MSIQLGGMGMAVDSKATGGKAIAQCETGKHVAWATAGEGVDPLVEQILVVLPSDSPRHLARAPGRLDLLGGSADYSGSLLLSRPLSESVVVGARRRTDGQVHITSIRPSQNNGHENVVSSIEELLPRNGKGLPNDPRRSVIDGTESLTGKCAVASLVELLASDGGNGLHGGVSLAIGSTLQDLSDGGLVAAVSTATVAAVGDAFATGIDPLEVSAVSQRVESTWLGWPVGLGDALCAVFGQADAIMQVAVCPRQPDCFLPIPEELELVGLDSGVCHEHGLSTYARVRCATFMGKHLIDRILRHEMPNHAWDGRLSRVSIADYVDRFRDRLPTKLAGREYLGCLGETEDALTKIEPDFSYKVRSRTEHHIYEHARACQFVECLSRGMRTRSTTPYVEAGELMYASHWSYGQRCGLGSVETDYLVSQIRKLGVQRGVYGAKITGRGCGGIVAILVRPSSEVFDAIEAIQQRYEKKTGRTCRLLRGSSPGASLTGVQRC